MKKVVFSWSCGFGFFIVLSILSSITGQILDGNNQSGAKTGERTVSDLFRILSSSGLTVDFRYNESYSGKGELSSVPGCPKSIDGYPWIYYGRPPRCFLAGHQGPCPAGRVLFVEKGSPFGICGCDCFQYKALGDALLYSPDKKYTFCPVTEQVFDNEKKVCYDLQNQGPCKYGEWLVRDRTGNNLICAPKCPFGLFYDYKQSRCVNLQLLGGEWGGSSVVPDCPQRHLMTYSKVLRKCVLKRPNDILFLG